MNKQESIIWKPASEKPDCDITVLCWADDEYFCGWWDSEMWRDSTAWPVQVEFWAIPNGPGGE